MELCVRRREIHGGQVTGLISFAYAVVIMTCAPGVDPFVKHDLLSTPATLQRDELSNSQSQSCHTVPVYIQYGAMDVVVAC